MYGEESFDTEYDEYIPGDLWDGGSLSPSSFNFADYRQSKRGKQVHYIFVSSASLVLEPRFMAQVYSKPAKFVHHPGLTFLPYTPCATALPCPWMATETAPWLEKWSDQRLTAGKDGRGKRESVDNEVLVVLAVASTPFALTMTA